jgi:DNA-binding CsgD family transcriptional regulator
MYGLPKYKVEFVGDWNRCRWFRKLQPQVPLPSKPPRAPTASNARLTERNAAIARRAAAGETQASLAREYNLSRERIRQIVVDEERRLTSA